MCWVGVKSTCRHLAEMTETDGRKLRGVSRSEIVIKKYNLQVKARKNGVPDTGQGGGQGVGGIKLLEVKIS